MKIRLHPLTRGLMALISLALGLVFAVPLWHIQLEAPQYPEGLGMGIWINRMSGDLDTINGLNHYIGMMEIHPGIHSPLPPYRPTPETREGLIPKPRCA